MGLDMYLNKKHYIGAKWEHRGVDGNITITVKGKPINIIFDRIQYIEEEIICWRKANAIHKWFVDNCQNGIDECQGSYVDYEQLKKLLSLVKRIKANPRLAKELLPVQSGCFFGGIEYDECYFEKLDFTIEQLEKVLAEPEAELSEYEYRSSW